MREVRRGPTPGPRCTSCIRRPVDHQPTQPHSRSTTTAVQQLILIDWRLGITNTHTAVSTASVVQSPLKCRRMSEVVQHDSCSMLWTRLCLLTAVTSKFGGLISCD